MDNTADPKGMLVAPSLWGLSHDDVPPFRQKADAADGEGDAAQALETDPRADEAEFGGKVNSVTFIERDDPFRLHKAGFKPLEQMSKNAWVSLPAKARPTSNDYECGVESAGSQSSCVRLHAGAASTY